VAGERFSVIHNIPGRTWGPACLLHMDTGAISQG